jgi:hypothetical protein
MTRRVPRERRLDPRRPGAECAWLGNARLRHGFDVTVLDVSAGGVLVEGIARLLPGSTVELQLVGPSSTWTECARVLRCQVCALVEQGVRYRAALQFERRLELPAGTQLTPARPGPGAARV